MQNPDRCNGRGFLFLQSVSAIQGSPELHRSACGWYQQLQARPLPCCGLIFTGGVKSSSNSRAFPHGKQNRDIAADTAAGAKLCTKIKRGSVTKCPIFPLVTMRFSGSASPRRVGRGSSQYLLPPSPVATHFPALSATMPRGGGSNTARRRYAALVRCMRLAVVLCYNFVSNSAWLYPLTPLVIMPRKSSREKSESRNTSSGFIPSCLPIS